jgi:signal transduction histidine kinase/ActR/RegA family two-component response regulator
MKLRTYYLLLAFSILLPAALFCAIALKVLLNAQHDSAIERIESSARLSAMVIDSDTHRAESVLRALAGSSALSDADMRRFDAEARAVNPGPGAWIILYEPASGQQLINTRHPFGQPLPVRPDQQQLAQLLSTGKANVSGMRWGEHLQNNFVMVEVPVTARSGKRYVIGQAFSPEFFTRSFAGSTIPAGWGVQVIDAGGTVIARSQMPAAFVGNKAKPEVLEALRAAPTGVLRHGTRDGLEVYDAYTRIAGSGWTIAVGAPVDEIDQAVWHGVATMGIGLFVAMIAALTLTILTGRRLVHFVAGASQAARLLGRGEQVEALAPSSIVELDELNKAILEAGDRLQAEVRSRSDVERERNQLLVLEKDARARAEEQNAAKDEFLAMLGHELRNPLSAVASAVHILDSGHAVDPSLLARARNVVRRQTDHLRKLVDDLLEVNRALMGKLTLDRSPVDLGDAVSRCVDTLHSSGRTQHFEFEVHTVAALVDADPTRLVQIIDNILDNAVKYSPDGGQVEVTVRHVDGWAELVVRDSGMGIAPELLPKVFTIFVQGKQSLQRVQGGLGIGLSLVRRLVDMHGGTVAIDSAGPGQGACVRVRLPLLANQAPPVPVANAAAGPAQRRVLLIEDNEDARDMMAALLEMLSCQVLTAGTGPQGIELALRELPEIAIIDIGLAGMDGYAIARALQANPATAQIELIALTGYGSAEDRQRAFDAGFQQHFTKPISLEQLELALSPTALVPHH